jgi:hypothetical protein
MTSLPTTPRKSIAAMHCGPGPANYLLPGGCGFHSHDYTKQRNPAFSFGARYKISSVGTRDSPGPAHYVVQSQVIRVGKNGTPSYSLFSRAKEDSLSVHTPAPDTYRVEQCRPHREPKAPSFSFGVRTPHRQKQESPSPNSYKLPSLLGSDVVGRRSSAAFSMTGRSKIGSFHEDRQKTPGPGKYKVTHPSVTKTQHPCYSMHGRYSSAKDAITTPGPGAYSPETVVNTRIIAPSFSFGIRHSSYLAPVAETTR